MRRLTTSIDVHAPSSFALAFVRTHFLERGAQGDATLALRFPLPPFPVAGLTLEKSVHLDLVYGAVDAGNDHFTIGWKPAETRALPSFFGALSAQPLGEETCRLTLEGGYRPPGGLPGAIFDQLVGRRIALATLRALLLQLSGGIEADYTTRMSSY